jgi:serine/threonine protein phosphatase 1
MYYAIGDIHGSFVALKSLYQAILDDITRNGEENNVIVFLGDVIDRGYDNLGVLKFLMGLQDSEKLKHIFLKGNHEDMMINVFDHYAKVKDYKSHLDDGPYHQQMPIMEKMWLMYGGQSTLNHLGITIEDFKRGAGAEFVSFIREFQLYYETEHYIFVHGCMDTSYPLAENKPETIMWGRINHYDHAKKWVIHGHTPTSDLLPEIRCNEINVDTAAGTGGYLTCVCLSENKNKTPYFLRATNDEDARVKLLTVNNFQKDIEDCLLVSRVRHTAFV